MSPDQVIRMSKARYNAVAVVHVLALAGAGIVVVLTAHSARWNPWWLGIIAALTISSGLILIKLASGGLRISASFLGLVLAAVLLGGAPAALLGVATIVVGRTRLREVPHYFRNNLATYAWFPLLSGLLFHAAIRAAHVNQHDASYYLFVFGTFVVALFLNFIMIAGYQSFLDGSNLWKEAPKVLQPILAPELFSAALTLVAVYMAHELGIVGLILFALVVVIFQYLVGELLVSQRRGEELQLLATTDELTGLANRKSFSDRVTRDISACRSNGEGFGVLLLDLDRFKEINDTLGHQYGDVLLGQLGPRLAAQVGSDGMVARLGGDEFAVMTGRRSEGPGELERIASDLMACVHEPIMIDDIALEVSSSVGIARYPEDGEDVQTLLRRADIAMYAAKEHRDGYRLYDTEHDYHSTRRLSLLGEFRQALAADEIVVHYQPIVDLRTLQVRGAESLVRWQHPKHGLLGPGHFLNIVEQTGLIGSLTHRVLDQSIAQCAHWHRQGLPLTIAVNLSVRNLLDRNLPHEVERLLARHSLAPAALQLEITESMIMSDPDRALATVRALSELGVHLAIDDFGTGHSSLANLKRLPIDELKIDRSFVTPMLHQENDLIIVRSTINLAHDLGLQIVAEGVEDAGTLDRLDGLGCDLAQGYHLSRPIPPDEFGLWIAGFHQAVA